MRCSGWLPKLLSLMVLEAKLRERADISSSDRSQEVTDTLPPVDS
jgi:hypothetical protein